MKASPPQISHSYDFSLFPTNIELSTFQPVPPEPHLLLLQLLGYSGSVGRGHPAGDAET